MKRRCPACPGALSGLQQRFDQSLGLDHIVFIIFGGLVDALTDQTPCGEVHHAIELFASEQLSERFDIARLSVSKASRQNR